jgi:hypothetical protein
MNAQFSAGIILHLCYSYIETLFMYISEIVISTSGDMLQWCGGADSGC